MACTGANRGLDYRLRLKVHQKYSPLRVALTTLGLSGKRSHEKFVPEMYKQGNAYQRLALLQGLLDTEGSVDTSPGTYASFTSTSERLAKDVQELAWSLGGIAKLRSRQTFYTRPDGSRAAGRVSYRVFIVHQSIAEMFSLPRKLARKLLAVAGRRTGSRPREVRPRGLADPR